MFRAEPLGPAQWGRGYALVRMLHPDLTERDWRSYIRRAARRSPGGLMAICDARGYCHAIFSYRIGERIGKGRLLRVSDVVMGRLPGATLPKALIACAEKLAEEHGGTDVAIDLDHSMLAPRDSEALAQAGFEPSGFVLTRTTRVTGGT